MARFEIVFLAAFCAACAVPAPVAQNAVCPPVKVYAPAQEAQAKVEYDALPQGDILRTLIDDYYTERLELRACRSTGKP